MISAAVATLLILWTSTITGAPDRVTDVWLVVHLQTNLRVRA